ncbi:MAG: UDP-2,3-diacylglucosamine diphosphatase [Betaproteobacteria bacterium]
MPPAIFASDLHLSPARPQLVAAFHAFVTGPARYAGALYLLGDIFDVWLGDDQLREPMAKAVAEALAELPGLGVPVFVQPGNRDFLMGERFARACGATLLPDEVVHSLGGTRTLLMHGDLLCTDDVEYQRFRAYWRDPVRRRRVLSRPYFVRRMIAAAMRFGSRRAASAKNEVIMDVNAGAVADAMRRHQVTRLIHGHTHRPAHHQLVVDGHRCDRWVLADWYRAASYLRVDASGVEAHVLEASARA